MSMPIPVFPKLYSGVRQSRSHGVSPHTPTEVCGDSEKRVPRIVPIRRNSTKLTLEKIENNCCIRDVMSYHIENNMLSCCQGLSTSKHSIHTKECEFRETCKFCGCAINTGFDLHNMNCVNFSSE